MGVIQFLRPRRHLAAAIALLPLAAGPALAEEQCGLCDKEIVTNSDLAKCFLDQYEQYAGKANGAVVVDLSACETSRGVVEALPAPNVGGDELDLKFMVSRAQLDCLKAKLEEPGLVLDPSAKIALDSCG